MADSRDPRNPGAPAPSPNDLQKGHEAALRAVIAELSGKGKESDWALCRALAHQAVHLSAERKAGEFCAVATLFAEMINHAHDLLHPGDRGAASHSTITH